MRLKGQQQNTGLKLAMLIGVVIVIAAVAYLIYFVPR
jgi:hypothetical protein